MKPVKHDGSSTGGPTVPLSKPMDKPPKQYTSNETVPRDDFHAEAPPSEVDNPGSFAKKFWPPGR
jgi:hypothetical protein